MTYKLTIGENAHYMETEGLVSREYETADEALAAARAIVDEDLAEVYKQGMTAEELFKHYTTFGSDPYVTGDDDMAKFSAWDYARGRAAAMCTEAAEPKPLTLADWFRVGFDASAITIDVRPEGREPRLERVAWDRIVRVCFKTGDYMASDEIYLFTETRPASYLIPTEAGGGLELWNEIIRRGLFDAELAIKAASTVGELFCDPGA